MSTATLVVMPADELAALVRAEVEAALDRAGLAAANVAPPSDWIGQEEAAKMLGVTPEYVRRMPGIPAVRAGRAVRFRRSELERWMAQRTSSRNSARKVG